MGYRARNEFPDRLETLYVPAKLCRTCWAACVTPALIIWGDDDQIVPLSAGQAYARALHDATLTTIPACGHFAEMEKPDAVAKLAIDFLSRN